MSLASGREHEAASERDGDRDEGDSGHRRGVQPTPDADQNNVDETLHEIARTAEQRIDQAARQVRHERLPRGRALTRGLVVAAIYALGVIPGALFGRERVHTGLTQLYEVGSMHERKALMADLTDAFIALPGGFGTLDEFFESLTWAQIGLHAKPIGLLDVADYFAPLRALVRHAVAEGFVPAINGGLLLAAATPVALLDQLAAYTPPAPGSVPLPGDLPER